MVSPNTLTYQAWLDMYAAPATSLAIVYGGAIAGRNTKATGTHAYRLDLSCGSYAVEAHEWSKQFTPERWRDAIRSGTRDAGVAQAEWELIGAL